MSFQVESVAESVEERPRAPDLPVIVQKNNREDVTERFGKFEIKAELESKTTQIFEQLLKPVSNNNFIRHLDRVSPCT